MSSMDKFCLRWNDFEANFKHGFRELREDKRLCDVTLATDDGRYIQAHKMILSTGSHFFNHIFLSESNHTYNNMLILVGILGGT